MSSLLIIVTIAIAALVIFVALPLVYVRNYIKVPPNEVAVFTGRGQPKVVRGGARFKMPGIERVDIMSLEPFNVNINLQNALSNNGVPVNVEAVGLVRIGSNDEAVQTAVQRFLTADLSELQRQINEILAGSLRGITATMTVEDLNSNRDSLARSVVEEAGGDLSRIGMEVDVLKIAGISDRNGYLESLGQRRIAEVRRDATVGTAQAERDAQIQSAQARQAGSIAQAEADTAIASANQKRDVELARLRAQTEAENAQADQAGPLAQARAEKDVGIAREQAEAARMQARTEVEQRRTEQAQAALQADVIAPAEARRQADIAIAEGSRQATILKAQADAEAERQKGSAEADARKAAADAFRIEQQAAADGTKAKLIAEADGIKAKLLAEADGKKEVAAALNAYTPEAARLLTLPDILASVVQATEAASKPIGEIERLSIIGGSGDARDALGTLLGVSPQAVAKVIESLKVSGIDVADLLNRTQQVKESTSPAPAPAAHPEGWVEE
ncbi:Inner membrane protein YqiK [Mycobacteroides salmoniphilum]|uniref:Inner membrane protein YqiK n=1 Tax=Mycobacteroides salmoniphilum TaxID=404941 RepID=A0A4R8S6V9_9MYCO|nr:flotillin family protein [Mycobacteroides salmoniphilum]TDZ75683.1 Inner membrane protein YqiK [Mycobacteroides salmoniphilum]TDZ83269.1 Inner membrane protein YqiK [Mycobacteroides salmoniphilum]TDZ84202.1 Inner membrane protein YqiK [Mycobacteroides salmoniphilum]